jgi:hypothetical protein
MDDDDVLLLAHDVRDLACNLEVTDEEVRRFIANWPDSDVEP